MLLCDDEGEAESKSITHKHERTERGEGRRDKLPHVQVGFRVQTKYIGFTVSETQLYV